MEDKIQELIESNKKIQEDLDTVRSRLTELALGVGQSFSVMDRNLCTLRDILLTLFSDNEDEDEYDEDDFWGYEATEGEEDE